MRSYEAARGYFSFLSFVSWGAIICGGLLALSSIGGNSATFFAGLSGGLILACVGFFGLVFAQTSRATVDSAEYAQQALGVARNQLDVSRQLLKLAEKSEQSIRYESPAATEDLKPLSYDTDAPAKPAVTETIEHLGRQIEKTSDGFLIEGRAFLSLEDAKGHVRELVMAPKQPLVVER